VWSLLIFIGVGEEHLREAELLLVLTTSLLLEWHVLIKFNENGD
jgi:hypothetical protein